MEAKGAALVVDEKELGGQSLAGAIASLLDDEDKLAAMGRSARAMSRPDAAARVADLLEGARA